MKRIIRYSYLFVAIFLVATSCKKAVPDQTKYIPKDALFVFDLNWKSLSEKTAKGNINWDSLFRSSINPGDDSSIIKAKKRFTEFMHSGVDTEKNVFVFVKTGGSMMSGQSTTGGIVAVIKNAAAFETYIKNQEGASEIKKGSNFSYATFSNDNLFIGWNKDVAILSGTESKTRRYLDTSGNTSNRSSSEQTLATLFNQKEDESVASIPEFLDLMNEKADMLFWSNSGSMFNTIPILGMTKISDLFRNSYGAGTVNFDNGKVTANLKSYSGKELTEILKKYPGSTVNMSMVNQYPLPVSGYTVVSFNPQVIAEIIKYGGLEGSVNQYLQKMELTLDDVLKAFKGDFAIVFSDLGMAPKEYEYNGNKFTTRQPIVKLVFNAAIGDKASYDKVVSKLADQGIMEMQNGQYVPKAMGTEYAWNMNGKNLVIATDNTLMQQYLSGKGNAAIPAILADKSKGKSFALYVDINKILQSFTVDTTVSKTMEAAKATFKNTIATRDNFNGKYIASDFELTTMNNNENSLVSLIKFFASASEQIEEHGKKLRGAGINIDSTDTITPPTTGQ